LLIYYYYYYYFGASSISLHKTLQGPQLGQLLGVTLKTKFGHAWLAWLNQPMKEGPPFFHFWRNKCHSYPSKCAQPNLQMKHHQGKCSSPTHHPPWALLSHYGMWEKVREISDENLGKLHLTKHPAKGERKKRHRTPSLSKNSKIKSGSQWGKRNKWCSKAPNSIKLGGKKKLDKVISLEEPSHTMITHLKIKVTYNLCKPTRSYKNLLPI
jgi:hypothetical protein